MEKDTSFEPFAEEFLLRTGKIFWCTATTADAQGRPRPRILHPIWQVIDGLPVDWVVTSQTPVKTTHLARKPHLACMYWNPDQNTSPSTASRPGRTNSRRSTSGICS